MTKHKTRPLNNIVVLGANGTMGFRSGALFAAAGCKVTYLARTKDKAEAGRRAAGDAVRSAAITKNIAVGSYDDLEKAVADADLTFEALAENFDIKRPMFERVDKCRRKDAIVATVSSGLDVTKLAEGLSDSFQQNFLGLHFFNPPQVIVGTELIAGAKTDPELMDFIEQYCEKRLGRLMVRTANVPGFAGNRVGFKVLNEAAQLAWEHGPLLIDKLVGPYTGRAMPPLLTIDLVGWDVHQAIVDNVVANCNDEAIDTYKMPDWMRAFADKGILGFKTKGGFFKRAADKSQLVLDVRTGDYKPASEIKLPKLDFTKEVAFLHSIGEYKKAMETFVRAPGDEATLARKVIFGYISYAFHRVGEVTETIHGIDRIMSAGFNWAAPSKLVDLIGLPRVIETMQQLGIPVPPVLSDAHNNKMTDPMFHDPALSAGKYFVAA